MRNHVELKGILPALVTPLTAGGVVDEAALQQLTDRLIDARVGGLVPCGSTGEFVTLTHDERRLVTETVVKAARGRVPVAPHTGALGTAETIALSVHAESCGASAVMVVPPFYEQPPWPDTVAHFRAVAEAIDIPIILYHIPSAMGYKLTAEQIGELADIEGVDFLKDSSADLVQLTEVIERYGTRIRVFNGWDSLTFYGFAAGTSASIWGAANFIPELCVELFETICELSDLEAARRVWHRIWPICYFLEHEGYVASVKAGCELIGHPAGPPRRPLRPLSAEAKTRLGKLLAQAKVAGATPARELAGG